MSNNKNKNKDNMNKDNNAPYLTEDEITKLKTKLEKEGMETTQIMWKANKLTEETIKNSLNKGLTEFEEKTGRSMSYSEMRDIFG